MDFTLLSETYSMSKRSNTWFCQMLIEAEGHTIHVTGYGDSKRTAHESAMNGATARIDALAHELGIAD